MKHSQEPHDKAMVLLEQTWVFRLGDNMEDLEMADVDVEGNEENIEDPKTEDGEIKILKTDILQSEPDEAEATEENEEDFTVSPIIIEEEQINDDADKEIATDAIQELVV